MTHSTPYCSLVAGFIRAELGKSQDDFFLALERRIDDYVYNMTTNSVKDTKARNKVKGDLFEDICLHLLQAHAFPFMQVQDAWLLPDLPPPTRKLLGLPRSDQGIDIVVRGKAGYYAVQCKYRKKPARESSYRKYPTRVPWRELSTFHTLCQTTAAQVGGWKASVVMTNCPGCSYPAGKPVGLRTLAEKSFQKIPKHIWQTAYAIQGHTLAESPGVQDAPRTKQLSMHDMRTARLKFLDSLASDNGE